MPKVVRDCYDDDDTRTNMEVLDITEHGCVVTERAYTDVDEETLKITHCLEITLEVPALDEEITRSLEDLQAECHGEPEFDV